MIKKLMVLFYVSFILSCAAQDTKNFQSELGINGVIPESWVHINKKVLEEICNEKTNPTGKKIPEKAISNIKDFIEKNGLEIIYCFPIKEHEFNDNITLITSTDDYPDGSKSWKKSFEATYSKNLGEKIQIEDLKTFTTSSLHIVYTEYTLKKHGIRNRIFWLKTENDKIIIINMIFSEKTYQEKLPIAEEFIKSIKNRSGSSR